MEHIELEQYILKYGRDIYSFCVFLTKKKQEADDLYQDTFLRAIEKNDIDSMANPKSYLISIAINIWNNKKRKYLWRKNKADMSYSLDEGIVEQVADQSLPTEEQAIRNDELENLRCRVKELPEKMRVVVLMYYMEDMPVEEISSILKIPAGTVKSRLHHAREILKKKMEENQYER
ncbi:MAG: RNA polymerase sigma factor [Lachnospiraceae bacterium]|nr:RNA polymerase sigma factor [Lachnospiraceae bacterium]